MKYLLIYNPVSGRSNNRINKIGKCVFELGKEGDVITVYQTAGKGDGARYMWDNDIDKYDVVIVCGGDGTLHEIVDGAIKCGYKGNLGYIPFGSTNDYARALGINSTNAIKVILEGNVNKLDLGILNSEHFNYVAAFGCFTDITYTTPQVMKNGIGYLAYLLESVKALKDIKPIHIKCKTDNDEIDDDIIVGLVTNALSVGGMRIKAIRAKLDDGKLEYVFIKYPSNLIDLQNTLLALVNNKLTDRYMYYGHSSSFIIDSDEIDWNLDGESGGKSTHAEISVLPKALSILSSE
jgi:YegS/Rv2252/BmrU family lipid kinase